MASGTAVVATETEGAREIISTEETGLLVPLRDPEKLAEAVLGLLDNKDWRDRLGTAARESVATHFSVERMIDETEEIYRAELEKQ
jgi:glycosyltransferase involved in cell wall biosynthesis